MKIKYIMYNTTRLEQSLFYSFRGRCDCVRMVAWLTINHNINVYFHLRDEWIPAHGFVQ